MDASKVSNIFKYLKDKYGEESTGLVRNWENTIKKMADFRNHGCFTLRCIKVRLTPASCKLKNPLQMAKVIISYTGQKDNYYITE